MPRAHDCITLLLGSKERYLELFNQNPGTYWYSRGWIECTFQPGEERYNLSRERYVKQYGEDNADFLMEMEQSWFKNYNRAFFIDWEELGNIEYYREYTKKCAKYLKWKYEECRGSKSLMEKLLAGEFDEEDFLVIPPGMHTTPSFDDEIIRAEINT